MARGSNKGDWNRICSESSEERVDTGKQRMRRGWLKVQPRNQKMIRRGLGEDWGRESEWC